MISKGQDDLTRLSTMPRQKVIKISILDRLLYAAGVITDISIGCTCEYMASFPYNT